MRPTPPCSELNADYIRHCQEEYGIEGLISFAAGEGGLPMATLRHPCGSTVGIYLHGAAVASWRDADGEELLHLRPNNSFDGEQPIRCDGIVGCSHGRVQQALR